MVKRYDMVDSRAMGAGMEEHSDGDWVRFEDYERLADFIYGSACISVECLKEVNEGPRPTQRFYRPEKESTRGEVPVNNADILRAWANISDWPEAYDIQEVKGLLEGFAKDWERMTGLLAEASLGIEPTSDLARRIKAEIHSVSKGNSDE